VRRYFEMMAEHGLQSFDREPWRWRVSRDEWDRLVEHTQKNGWPWPTSATTTVGGFPIAPDDSLPPNSVIFEPIPSSLSPVPGTETEPENEQSAASTAVGRDVR
jgi:YD repeat-containing protein